MKVIAKTENGVLIEATNEEVQEIHSSVTGNTIEAKQIVVGMKLPAIDYAASIKKVRTLASNYELSVVEEKLKRFVTYYEELKTSIKKASEIEL